MSISFYTGTPGSGKSYHCTKDIIEYLKRGRNVISNFPLNLDFEYKGKFVLLEDDELTVEYLLVFAKMNHSKGCEGQTLVVVDEAQLKFNSRDWNNKGRSEWCSFFTVHRHLGYEFILSTQNDEFIDKQIRGLVEYNFNHRNLKKTKMGYIFPFMPTVFLCKQSWYVNNTKIALNYGFYHQKIGNKYDSYVFFDKILSDVKIDKNLLKQVEYSENVETSENVE